MGSYASLGLVPVTQLAIFTLTARAISANAFGEYIALTSTCLLLSEAVGLGAGERLIRSVSREQANYPSASGHLIAMIAVTAPLLLIAHVLLQAVVISPTQPLVFIIGAAALELPCSRLIVGAEQVALGSNRVGIANLVRGGAAVIRLSIFAGFFGLGMLSSLGAVLVAAAISSLVAALATWALILKVFGSPRVAILPAEIRPGISLATVQLVRAFQQNGDRMILALVLPKSALAVYAAGMRVVMAGYLPLQVYLRSSYAPYFSAFRETSFDGVFCHGMYVLPRALLIGVIIALGLFATSFFLPFLLGAEYASAVPLVQLAAGIWLVVAAAYVGGDILVGAERPSLRSVVTLLSAAIQATLTGLLGSKFGSEGAIAALYVSSLSMALLTWCLVYYLHGRSKADIALDTEI